MLMQLVVAVSVFSTYVEVISGNAAPFPTSTKQKYPGHRERRQINLFGFNTDLGQVITRTINNINLIRDTFQYGRDLGNTISNVFNPVNGTADAVGIYPNSPLRNFQDRFEQLRKRTRDSLFTYMKRIGLAK